MKELFTTFFLTGLLLSACTPKPAPLIPTTPSPNESDDSQVVCTQDAKQCPDGSYVGRSGPNCEFAACPEISYKTLSSSEIEKLTGPFNFSFKIPSTWQAEAVPEIEAINIYDPNFPAVDNLEKSQIFIRYFKANDFLTLSTVTIFNKTATTTLGQPAVVYDIEKKAGVDNFAFQPTWRNQRHFVTDIKSSAASPAIFYVMAKSPNLSDEIFSHFIYSLNFIQEKTAAAIEAPSADWKNRITKKPFGLYVTPKNSPVSPEKFSGYHTAIDVEYDDITTEVPVYAISDGIVKRSGTVSGYGGLVALTQTINGKTYLAIYGHLNPANLPKTGAEIKKGQQLGILGDGYTLQTSGERKHLHFGLYTGSDINVAGYVSEQSHLSAWVDPEKILP